MLTGVHSLPKNQSTIPIPDNFPLPAFLHPFHYFTSFRYKNYYKDSESVQNCVNNICGNIPYIEIEAFESLKKKLTQQVQALFVTMNAPNVPNSKTKDIDQKSVDKTLKHINKTIKEIKDEASAFLSNNIEKISEKDPGVSHMIQSLHFILPYLNDDEYKALLRMYTDLRVHELCCANAYQSLSSSAFTKDIQSMQMQNEIAIQKRFYTFLSALSQQMYDSPRMKEELIEKISSDLTMFCSTVENASNVKFKYQDQYIHTQINEFVTTFFDAFRKVEKYKTEQVRWEATFKILEEQRHLKASSPEAENRLLQEINEAKKGIIVNTKLKELENSKINEHTSILFRSLIQPPNQDKFSQVCKEFNIPEKDIFFEKEKSAVDALSEIIANTWFSKIGNTLYSYMPSMDTMQQGLKTSAKYAAATTVGTMALGPLGTVLAPTLMFAAKEGVAKVQEGIQSVQNTIYGEFTLKYQGKQFELVDNIKYAFEDKAEAVNNFYMNTLFQMDIAISDMPKLKQKEANSQQFIKMYQKLSEDYQKLREGNVDSREHAQSIFRDNIKMLLKHDYQNDIRNTAQCIVNLHELQKLYKEYEKVTPQDERKSELLSHSSLIPQMLALAGTSQTISTVTVEEIDDDEPEFTPKKSSAISLALVPITKKASAKSDQVVLHQTQHREWALQPTETQKKQLDLENKMVKLSQQNFSYNQQMTGTSSKLNSLLTLGVCLNMDDLSNLRETNIDTYRKIHQSPLDLSFEEHVKTCIYKGEFGHLKFWFKEKCFNILSKDTVSEKRTLVGTPLSAFDNKPLWYLLCDHPKGNDILDNIIELQKQAIVLKKPWVFADYFDPNIECNGMNPIAYAISVGNLKMARSFLENMATCQSSFTQDEQIKCFNDILKSVCHGDLAIINNAKLFCEKLTDEIANFNYNNQSYLSLAASRVTSTSKPDYMEIMSALTICLAKGNPIPTKPNEIKALLLDMQHSKSGTSHVAALKDMKEKDMEVAADNIEKYINGRSALLDYVKSTLIDKSDLQKHFGLLLATAEKNVVHPHKALNDTEQAVLVAVLTNNYANLDVLLKNNASLATLSLHSNKVGVFNLLYLATKLGHVEAAIILYSAGTPVEECGPDDNNPKQNVSALVLAAQNNPNVLLAILDERKKHRTAGYQRKAHDTFGKTAFHYLAESGNQLACIRWIKTESDTRSRTWIMPQFCNLYDNEGNSPLHLLVKSKSNHAIQEIDKWMRLNSYSNGIANIFIDSTNNALTKRNNQKLTPIEIALQNKDADTFKFLLELMIDTKTIAPVEKDILIKINECGFNLPILLKELADSNKEHYFEKDFPRFLYGIATYSHLAILSNNKEAIEMSWTDCLDLYKDSLNWSSVMTPKGYTKAAILEFLKFSLVNANPIDMNPIIEKVIAFAKTEGIKKNSPSIEMLLIELNKQKDNPGIQIKLNGLISILIDHSLIDEPMLLKNNIAHNSKGSEILAIDTFDEILDDTATVNLPPTVNRASAHTVQFQRVKEIEKEPKISDVADELENKPGGPGKDFSK